jgi:hypothetical protein
MKKSLILNTNLLAINYRENMLQHLFDCQNDDHTAEFGADLIQFGTTLKNFTSPNNSQVLSAFRTEFGAGFTMMMLSDEEFSQLEDWSCKKEDFQLVLFREDGSPVGVINGDYINW